MEKIGKTDLTVGKLHIFESEGPVKAFCDLVIADSFIVKGLKVVEGKEGFFVGMPSVQGRDGKWFDTFYPLNKEIKRTVEEQILRTYKERTGNNAAEIT